MDTIHEELIYLIVSFLAGEWPNTGRIAALATVSKRWRRAVERHTFKSLRICSKDDDLEALQLVVLANPRRRAQLRYLQFSVVLNSDESAGGRANSSEEQANAGFSEGIVKLFRALASAYSGGGGDGIGGTAHQDTRAKGITLQIVPVLSPRAETKKKQKRLRQHVRLLTDASSSGYSAQDPALLSVTCVSELVLNLQAEKGRLVMRTALDLARHLPRLSRLVLMDALEVPSDDNPNLALHADDRQDLADALADAAGSPSSLREVSLSIEAQDPWSVQMRPSFVFPDLTRPVLSTTTGLAGQAAMLRVEPLGSALRTWSTSLVSLDLCGVFDGSLFWPPGERPAADAAALPFWPNLKHLSVKLGISTPSGGWYFTRKLGAARDDHRNVPCEDELQPLFAAWSRALERMPTLESAALFFDLMLEADQDLLLQGEESAAFGRWLVAFQAPRSRPRQEWAVPWVVKLAPEQFARARLVFQCVSGWRPWRGTMERLNALSGQTSVLLEVDLADNVSVVDA